MILFFQSLFTQPRIKLDTVHKKVTYAFLLHQQTNLDFSKQKHCNSGPDIIVRKLGKAVHIAQIPPLGAYSNHDPMFT